MESEKNTFPRSMLLVGLLAATLPGSPTFSHHSFAMYDQQQTRTFTGRLMRFIPGANHSQLIFQLIDAGGEGLLAEDGGPLLWGVETGSARALAQEGITVKSFPLGTILTVTLNPLRDGRNFGARVRDSALIACGQTLPDGGCTQETGEVFAPPGNLIQIR